MEGHYRMKKKTKRVIAAIERDNNHSWFEELYRRNSDSLEDTALFYRGNSISYKEIFEKMRLLAGALQSVGVKKGTEIPVCLSNSPELIYLMGAASLLGAKINVFSVSFPLDYIKEIICGCDSKIGFFEDNHFERIHSAVEASGLERYILCSLGDSLPPNTAAETVDGHEFVNFVSNVEKWTKNDARAVWFYNFMYSESTHLPVLSDIVRLEDEFSITYTSGSTNALRPKAIVQCVRSFNIMGRFHDADLMHGMSFKRIRGLAIIPPYSNTDLISCISDTLMQGAVLSMEPVYDERFFLDSLLLNRPNFVTATRSFWITAMKRLLLEDRYRNIKLPFLLLVFAVGEELSINEEKLLNNALRKAQAGKDFFHMPISPVYFCVAGGDCEHGSILYRLFRAVSNYSFVAHSEKHYGMTPFDFVDIAVLDSNGKQLGSNQVGRLVANSPCTMKCYKNNQDATKAFFIKDSLGNTWGDMSVFGYKDKRGRVYMRNRILENCNNTPPYKIADEILRCKSILSCEVVWIDNKCVAHVEFVPNFSGSISNVLRKAHHYVKKRFGDAVSSALLYRIHSGVHSFQLTRSGKRDIKALMAEGDKKAFPLQ